MFTKVKGGWQVRLGDYRGPVCKTKSACNVATAAELHSLLRHQSFNPIILIEPGTTNPVLITCSVEGLWSYSFYKPCSQVEDGYTMCSSCSSWPTAHLAFKHCRRNLAQMAYEPGSGESTLNWLLQDDVGGRSNHASWCMWQDRYSAAITAGKTDRQARAYADGEDLL